MSRQYDTSRTSLKLYIITAFLLSVVIGGFLAYFYTIFFFRDVFLDNDEYTRYSQVLDEMSLAVRQNNELIHQYQELSSDVNTLKTTYDANEIIRSNIDKYEMVLGYQDLIGSGVILTVNIDLAQFWLIDILSELYDLGAEIIALNDILISPNTSIQYDNALNEMFINDKRIESPYKFDIIGNPNILLKGLTSNTGLIESLNSSFPNRSGLINIEIPDEIKIISE